MTARDLAAPPTRSCLLDGAMTPLVIGLPAVVAVIVLAVVIGLHLIKKNERARLGDPPPSKDRPAKAGRGPADGQSGGGNGGGNEPWREPARPRRPAKVPAAPSLPPADERRPVAVPAPVPPLFALRGPVWLDRSVAPP